MTRYEQLMQKLKEEAEEEQARREAMSICPQCGGRLGGPLFGYACLGKLLPHYVPGRGHFGKSCGYKLSTK